MSAVLLAAIVTPLRDGGEALDEEAIEPLVRFVEADGHCDGLFIAGTTGEGFLMSPAERRRAAELFCGVSKGRRLVHAGAQSTADTVALASHAAEIGADGVAVIPPPYYPLDDAAVVEHLVAAGQACAPVPYFIYVFSARSGYRLSLDAVEAVAERLDNLVGLKVTAPRFEDVEPYLGLGLEVFVGSEATIPEAIQAGAAGAASALAGIDPARVREVLDSPSPAGAEAMIELYEEVAGYNGLIPGLKKELRRRGVPIRVDVRKPLRSTRSSGPLESGETQKTSR